MLVVSGNRVKKINKLTVLGNLVRLWIIPYYPSRAFPSPATTPHPIPSTAFYTRFRCLQVSIALLFNMTVWWSNSTTKLKIGDYYTTTRELVNSVQIILTDLRFTVYTNILYRNLSRKEVRTSTEADGVGLLNNSRLINSIFNFHTEEQVPLTVITSLPSKSFHLRLFRTFEVFFRFLIGRTKLDARAKRMKGVGRGGEVLRTCGKAGNDCYAG